MLAQFTAPDDDSVTSSDKSYEITSKMKLVLSIIMDTNCVNDVSYVAPRYVNVSMPEIVQGVVWDRSTVHHKQYAIVVLHQSVQLNLCQYLRENKISCQILGGSVTKLQSIITAFRSGLYDVLIINNIAYSSGIDLSFATDLIIYAASQQQSVQSQIYGRLQRSGRSNSAIIHLLSYGNENHHIK